MNALYNRVIELYKHGLPLEAIVSATGASTLIVAYVLRREFYDEISGEIVGK